MTDMEETAETYDPSRYERPSVTVDVVIFTLIDRELHVLLVRRKRAPSRDTGRSLAALCR